MKKSSVFMVLLLLAILVEAVVLIYDVFTPQPSAYQLDSQEITVISDTQESEQNDEVFGLDDFVETDGDAARADNSVGTSDEVAKTDSDDMVRFFTEENAMSEIKAELNAVKAEIKQSKVEDLLVNSIEDAANSADKQETGDATVASAEAVDEAVEDLHPEIKHEENLSALPAAEGRAKYQMAIIIDDVGLNNSFIKELTSFNKPLTVSLLPYGISSKHQAESLKNAGMEIMVHVPMMPHVPAALAPVTLSPEMDKTEVQKELTEMLDRFSGAGMVGVNNHMGSLFTEKSEPMNYVMEVLHKRGMYFLDSKTTAKSVCQQAAQKYGVPFIARDVFLDNENNYNYIMGQLSQAEKIARKKGYAVVIGHPRAQTLKAVRDWVETAGDKDFELVHLSVLVDKINR